MTIINRDFQTYSDLFKDVYGYRPRGENYATWTEAEYDQTIDYLQAALEEVMACEKNDEAYALSQFQARVADLRNEYGLSERDAFIWFFEAETGETLENRNALTGWDQQKVEQFLYSQGVSFDAWPELLTTVGLKEVA